MNKINIERIKEKFNSKGLTLLDNNYKNAFTRMKCCDKEGYLYSTSWGNIDNFNCRNKFATNNPYCYDNYLLYMKKYINNNTKIITNHSVKDCDKVKFKCGICGNIFEKRWKDFMRNKHKMCPSCAFKNKPNIIEDIRKEFKKYNVEVLSDIIKTYNDKIIIKDKYGYKGLVDYYNFKNNRSFNYYIKNNPYTIENIKLYLINNNINSILLSNIYKNGDSKLEFKCKCGNIFNVSFNALRAGQYYCKKCSSCQSRNENLIETYLNELNIEYKEEFKFDDCKFKQNLKFDFYIPSKKLIIEVDGEEHYKPINYGGISNEKANKEFELCRVRDSIKNEYCNRNNINLLRLPYYLFNKNKDYIKIINKNIK